MHKDERDLLDVLKFELGFLEKGSYSHSPRDPWRPQFIFEDSPTCMNYDSKDHPGPCSERVLMQLVPLAFHKAKIPCRHIAFNAEGETLDSMYRYADQSETEIVLANWLRTTIARLEEKRRAHRDDSNKPSTSGVGERKGKPVSQSLHPKCANPACLTAFHWLGGGKFFRFRPESAGSHSIKGAPSPVGTDSLKHYWLGKHCSHVFTLAYEESHGAVVKLLWPELCGDRIRCQSAGSVTAKCDKNHRIGPSKSGRWTRQMPYRLE
jgi:hypothetical protein